MKRKGRVTILVLGGIFLIALLSIMYLTYWPGYVLHAAWEEIKILSKRKNISEMIMDKNTPPETRNKLALALEARDFAKKRLGLMNDKLYEYYSEVGDTLAFVVSASPINQLTNKVWSFPIVGSVPYLGFFDEKEACRVTKELEGEGFDTYLRPTPAFSTLGWLSDPILSTMLRADSLFIVETIIHESVHPTIWIRGNTQFNESLAKFVGMVGAKEFFCEILAKEEWCQKAQAGLDDALLVSDLFDVLHDSLSTLYEKKFNTDLILKSRVKLLSDFNNHFQKNVRPQLKSNRFIKMDLTRLNNASFLARHLYYRKLGSFYSTYRKSGQLSVFLKQLLSAIPQYANPWDALESI